MGIVGGLGPRTPFLTFVGLLKKSLLKLKEFIKFSHEILQKIGKILTFEIDLLTVFL